MPAKNITVPAKPDMKRSLDELCELNALQLPSLASMLLWNVLAGRRSALPPKRVQAPQNAGDAKEGSGPRASGGAWGLIDNLPFGIRVGKECRLSARGLGEWIAKQRASRMTSPLPPTGRP